MATTSQTAPIVSKPDVLVGWILGLVPVAFLVMTGVTKLVRPDLFVEGFTRFGFDISVVRPLGVVQLVCTVLYLFPRTAVLGAVLLTGYMGGAIATHLRVGDLFYVQFGLAVLLWLGLYLRDLRIRALLPLRSECPEKTKGMHVVDSE
jgi:hypothetical protein